MAFITVDGENQIAAKQGASPSQTLNIVNFVLANVDGLGAEPANRIEGVPTPADIMATLPVTQQGYVNTNQVVYSLVMDSSIGDFDFNWIGLVDDEGVLIAVTYTPLIQKRQTSGAIPGNNMTRSFLVSYTGIQATTAIAVPAETWQIDFNGRLLGIDERERLSNFDVYGEASFFGASWSVVRLGATANYDVMPGVGYVNGIRIASAVAQTVSIATTPASVWLDVSLQGNISDMSANVDFVIDNVSHADYTDINNINHYFTKIAEIAADGSVTDVRVSADFLADHVADLDPHPMYLTETEADARYAGAGEMAAHTAAADPHPNYLTQTEANGLYADVNAVASHESLPDPHPMYLTPAEANVAYEPAGSTAAHEGQPNPHPIYLTQAEADSLYGGAGEMPAHNAHADPHPMYLTPAEGNAAYEVSGAVVAHEANANPHPQYAHIESRVKAGTTIIWHSEIPPAGYFECNGAAISRTTYSALFAVLGTRYGAGDGTTTFNLPDTRGEFLRGWSHGSGNDPDAATRLPRADAVAGDNIGTKQGGEVQSHHHTVQEWRASGHDITGGDNPVMSDSLGSLGSNRTIAPPAGGNETRPRNINVMFCIKF